MTATATARFTVPRLLEDADSDAPRGQTAHFTTVATAVVRGRGLGLSPWAKLLYVVLRSYTDPAGRCYPGYATLQADVGCGINQLTRAGRELEAAGLINRRRRGQGKSILYTVHAPGPAPAEASQTHRQRDTRVTPRVKPESLHGGTEQDSGDLDPDEQHQEAPTPTDSDDCTSAGDDALVASLTEHGITQRIAVRLVTTHGARAVEEQLEWHASRPAAKNPAGALVRAIQERWPAPPAWVGAQAHAATTALRAEQKAARLAEEAVRRQEQEARPPEERIAGRLTFWVHGRRAKRLEPSEAEIAAKRAELLAELTGAPRGMERGNFCD